MTPSHNSKDLLSSWVSEFGDDLYKWAFFKVNDEETAKDIVQDTFVSAYNSIEGFQNKSSPKTWLFTILRNKVTDYYRSAYKRKVDSESSFNIESEMYGKDGHWKKDKRDMDWRSLPSQELENQEFKNILQNCFSKLPDKWRIILQAKFISEKESKEICKEFEISPSNYWQIIHRGKLQLRVCLEKNWLNE